MYQYLTKEKTGLAFSDELYKTYTELVNRCYGINQPEINLDMIEIVKTQMHILLDRDYNSNTSFITMNNSDHYDLMNSIIEVFGAFSQKEFYGYASQVEFYDTLDLYRKRFNQLKLNALVIATAVGKNSKKTMQRFNHERYNVP